QILLRTALMGIASHIVATFDTRRVRQVTCGTLGFIAFVAISEPDLERVSDFIPPEQLQQGHAVHVTAVTMESESAEQIAELADNLSEGDIAVFLCAERECYLATLRGLGSPAPDGGAANGDVL